MHRLDAGLQRYSPEEQAARQGNKRIYYKYGVLWEFCRLLEKPQTGIWCQWVYNTEIIINKTLSSLRIKSLIIQVYIKFIAICMPVTKNYNVVFRLITAYTISIIYVKIIF